MVHLHLTGHTRVVVTYKCWVADIHTRVKSATMFFVNYSAIVTTVATFKCHLMCLIQCCLNTGDSTWCNVNVNL